MSKTFANSSIDRDSDDVKLKGYKLIRADHPFILRCLNMLKYYMHY